jgi:hypothetical protein
MRPKRRTGYARAIISTTEGLVVAFPARPSLPLRGVRRAVTIGDFELSATGDPPFTTVSVAAARIGRVAATFRLDGAVNGLLVQVPFRIVERVSS